MRLILAPDSIFVGHIRNDVSSKFTLFVQWGQLLFTPLSYIHSYTNVFKWQLTSNTDRPT